MTFKNDYLEQARGEGFSGRVFCVFFVLTSYKCHL